MKNITTLLVSFTLLWHAEAIAIEQDNIHALVGKMISYKITKTEGEFLDELPEDIRKSFIHSDTEFTLTYKVLETFEGSLVENEVEFKTYGRYQIPPFSEYKHVLLFLTGPPNNLILKRHQYFDAYRTNDDKWATCGKRDGYLLEDIQSWPEWYLKNITDVNIASSEQITYDIEDLNDDITSWPDKYNLEDFYPEKYFNISDGKAICKGIGISAEELARDHKKLILKYRD